MPELNSALIVGEHPEIIQLSFGIEQANTYLVAAEGHAVVIDACSERVVDVLVSRNCVPDFLILTHEHADHIWGVNALRERFPDLRVIAQERCSNALGDPRTNKAAKYRIYAILRFGEKYRDEEVKNRTYHCAPAEIVFQREYALEWMQYNFRLIHTPGHSPGSVMVFLGEHRVFSGDTMLTDGAFLKFDGGDEAQFSTIALPVIRGILPEAQIFPGHGAPFQKLEWKEQ